MGKVEIQVELENISKNLNGTITYSFKHYGKADRETEQTIEQIKTLSVGAKNGLKIAIGRYYKQRSLNANSYFHLLVGEISKKLNAGNDEIKIKMNLEYGTIALNSKGQPFTIKLPEEANITEFYDYAKFIGSKVENEKTLNYYVFYKQTHKLNNAEMARLIDGVVNEAKELGIQTLTPNQKANMLSLWGENENRRI